MNFPTLCMILDNFSRNTHEKHKKYHVKLCRSSTFHMVFYFSFYYFTNFYFFFTKTVFLFLIFAEILKILAVSFPFRASIRYSAARYPRS